MIDLVPHPQSRAGAVRGIHAEAARAPDGRLALRYRIEGDLERLRIAPPSRPAPGERLWEHSCCEAFVASAGAVGYQEFNFSPSRAWAAYTFRSYRQGEPCSVADPGIDVRRRVQALELRARVPAPPGRLSVALCAVIEDCDGVLSYWALHHPAGKPDFHHRDGFALELD